MEYKISIPEMNAKFIMESNDNTRQFRETQNGLARDSKLQGYIVGDISQCFLKLLPLMITPRPVFVKITRFGGRKTHGIFFINRLSLDGEIGLEIQDSRTLY